MHICNGTSKLPESKAIEDSDNDWDEEFAI